ncbi:MAG: hypothetical protein RI934_575 [Bacteroidota bacterium]|jgi:L-threonylcarbamoyladenylate synthase
MNYAEEIKKTIPHLTAGNTILYPTDTIWGLGCDARNEAAVEKIIALKKRPPHKSFVLLLDNEQKLQSYIQEVPEIVWNLIEYADRPLTLILPGAKNLAKNAINEDGSIGIRIIKAGFANQLIQRFKFPIVSTSINISGEAAAIDRADISDYFINAVDYTCEINESGTGQPSTIMKIATNGTFEFIRK